MRLFTAVLKRSVTGGSRIKIKDHSSSKTITIGFRHGLYQDALEVLRNRGIPINSHGEYQSHPRMGMFFTSENHEIPIK